MPEPLLPLFPLGVVLLPQTPMPLHIFEQRYREMIGQAIANKTEFGIVQAGENGILSVGCTATVEDVIEKHEDGRLDIIVVGRRRFEIILLNEEESFLRAAVSWLDDEDDAESVPLELKALAMAGLNALMKAGDSEPRVLPDYRDPDLSFKIAYFVPDLGLRQTLLTLRSEAERLRHLNDFLPDYAARVRRTTHVRKVAPTNGHGMIRMAGEGLTE